MSGNQNNGRGGLAFWGIASLLNKVKTIICWVCKEEVQVRSYNQLTCRKRDCILTHRRENLKQWYRETKRLKGGRYAIGRKSVYGKRERKDQVLTLKEYSSKPFSPEMLQYCNVDGEFERQATKTIDALFKEER